MQTAMLEIGFDVEELSLDEFLWKTIKDSVPFIDEEDDGDDNCILELPPKTEWSRFHLFRCTLNDDILDEEAKRWAKFSED